MGNCCSGEEEIDDGEMSLRQFQLLRSIGRGAFGKVRIVQKKDDKKLYALKYINKEKCIKMKAVQNVIQERQLLEQIKHPFIVNLQFAFQDDENMFMVLDLMLGGDLRFRLDRSGPINEDSIRFYAAEIALSLDYLHKERIVHRDIKPDNLLLDEFGHLHLTDFNVAIRVKQDKVLTAAAGTRAYMAPEILRQKTDSKDRRTGYFTTVDWWRLGVVMFECLFGRRPFQGKTSDELSHNIMYEDWKYPSGSTEKVSAECLSAISGFLERDITKRLGCGPTGLQEIKEHPFFSSLDWDKLLKKEITPPWIPDSNKVHFDATFELEEMLLEDNPLKAKPKKKQRKPRGNSESDQQFLEMEEKFRAYSTLTRKSKTAEMTREEASRQASVAVPSGSGDVTDPPESQRARGSATEVAYFPNEKDIREKEVEVETRPSVDVVQEEEDNVREE